MLWSAPDREFWQISSATDEAPWGRPACGPKPEQGLKRGHRSLAAIVPKGEFVKIDLQVLAADAVIRADEPLLQVADRAVCQRHDRRHAAAQRAPGGLRAGQPPAGFQILPASRFIGELPLELPEAGRERRTGHAGTLLIVVS